MAQSRWFQVWKIKFSNFFKKFLGRQKFQYFGQFSSYWPNFFSRKSFILSLNSIILKIKRIMAQKNPWRWWKVRVVEVVTIIIFSTPFTSMFSGMVLISNRPLLFQPYIYFILFGYFKHIQFNCQLYPTYMSIPI